MALAVVVVENVIADQLVALLKQYASAMKIGPPYDKTTNMAPVVNQGHKELVLNSIETGIKEGSELVLDGRKPKVDAGFEKRFYLGPTIFDKVTEDMSIGREEIFGPVVCVKRVNGFEDGLEIMNTSRFANGSVIYTQNRYYARTFAKETYDGMVGIDGHSRSGGHFRIHRAETIVLRRSARDGP
jgi:malonate-semialdehyde dehydrogenase (acetylating)/methylmalonate-semialdehyde dehydrogenase